MAKFKNRKITVLVPAHNEEDQISETVLSLKEQTHKPDNVVVIADNCNDQTVEICKGFSFVEIFITVNNKKKKAGALNQWLDKFLDTICDEDLLMVMDADSTLDQKFIENALPYIERGFSACGGVFTGKIGGGIVGSFQRNEYARYERDIRRKDGATLVLTGTATIFLASALKDVVTARSVGKLPCIDGEAHVYDTGALTEDNELTFALLHLDHAIIAPAECALKTEVMTTWKSLGLQRLRWKRGAIENNIQYGFTKITLKYWGLQVWGLLGIFVTAIYLSSIVYAIVTNNLNLQLLWIIVTIVYMAERMVTVHKRGALQTFIAGLIVIEMSYDIFLQSIHLLAIIQTLTRAKKEW